VGPQYIQYMFSRSRMNNLIVVTLEPEVAEAGRTRSLLRPTVDGDSGGNYEEINAEMGRGTEAHASFFFP
jgi:hypothetical protein